MNTAGAAGETAWRVYTRLSLQCRTVNQLNRLHILLERRSTPEELEAIQKRFSNAKKILWSGLSEVPERYLNILPKRLRKMRKRTALRLAPFKWKERTARPTAGSRPREAGGWRVLRRTKSHLMFERVSPSASPEPRRLLVAFTSIAQVMGLPLPVFLSSLPDGNLTVLVFITSRQHRVWSGVRGLGDGTWNGLVSFVDSLLGEHSDLLIVGYSAGAYPAIALHTHFPSSRALAIGTHSLPGRSFLDSAKDFSWPAPDSNGLLQPTGRLVLAYGADSERDKEISEALSSLALVEDVVAIPNAPHSCIYPMHKRGEFVPFINQYLFSDPSESVRFA